MRRKTNASKHSTTSRDSIMGKAKEDKKKNIMIVKEIIFEICDILRIQVPQISFKNRRREFSVTCIRDESRHLHVAPADTGLYVAEKYRFYVCKH